MKAPNKIYLQICGDCPGVDSCGDCKFEDLEDNVTWCLDRIFEKDVEYVCKDALLKWLDKELDRLYELLPDASNDNPSQIELRHLGQYMQTEKLIDKLNEI